MQTTTLPIGKFFELLEKYENLNFKPEMEEFLESDIKIPDEHGNWIGVTAAITKKDEGLRIVFNNGDEVKGAKKHLISTGDRCVFLESLVIGDSLTKSTGEIIEVVAIESTADTLFYDLTVDSETHLYQTANNIVHHNTETAKALAKHLGSTLIRFDMSEFQEKHSISKLIGSPPGYVGFDDNAGLLITKIQEHPNAVLLFDEVEKSHPDVTTVLLQMMDNGFVTGSNGKRADCRNVLLLLTTNAGAQSAEKNAIGFGSQEKNYSDDDLKKFFAPEFRNRLDGVITFNKLTKDNMIKVINKFVDELRDQVKDKGIKIKLTKEATNWLLEKGFDPKMGARPLHRVIDKEVKRDLAKLMLFGELKQGGTLTIGVIDNSISLSCIPKLTKQSQLITVDNDEIMI